MTTKTKSKTKEKMTKAHCSGCRDNFYNGFNDYGINECWLFKKAKLIERKKIPMDQAPPWNQPSQTLPSCYRQKGYAIFDGDPKGWKA